MTIAMKNNGEGTPVVNETGQETTTGTTTPNQNSPASLNIDLNTTNSQPNVINEVKNEEEAWLDPITGEPYFPISELARLEEMISRTRWVVPVLPKCELEVLLDASINLCKRGLDTRSEPCQRFFQDGLTKSFNKILTDDAVSSWKFEIQRCILRNCEKLIELCVSKLSQDWFPLLELLAVVLNPQCKFHTFNLTRPSELYPINTGIEEDIFAKAPDIRAPRGWLVDLINRFGKLNGFQQLLERFQSEQNLSLQVMFALIRPFGLCHEMLTISTITKFFLPIIEVIPAFLDNLSDEELKKESKNEGKNDLISALVKFLKSLALRVPGQEEILQNLEMFRLKMILRLLQISSFNGKMNALNEINKVIASVASYPHRTTGNSVVTGTNETEEEWLTAERMAAWLKEHKVLQIVLADSLHQPQYVEKLEKILRFVIKEKALTLDDLDRVWASQAGKHEAIVKNVHDLLAKLAWDFSPEQLDHLFECFQASWTNAGKKQREKLLELIRRLAEDDKDGVMAHKVLTLFWNLAHSPDVPNEIIDQAMTAHVKILDYSCSQDRDTQKTVWLDRCVEEIRRNVWVVQALKQIRDICCLYAETPANYNHAAPSHTNRVQHVLYRQEVVNRLQQQHALVILITDNLCAYMERVRSTVKEHPTNYDPQTYLPDDRYNHVSQVQDRLSFLRFLLKDGQLWLCAPQARQIWHCLVERAIFVADREACFKWFSKLMGEEPDLDPEVNRDFFENQILQLDPSLMTESGMKCFDRFFKAVNAKEGKLVARRKMNDVGLTGLDYLWRVILFGSDPVAEKYIQLIKAIHLLKETYTSLGPRLVNSQVEVHEDLISSCCDRLRAAHDTLRAHIIQQQQQQPHETLVTEKDFANRIRQETTRMCRLLKLLHEYVGDYDCDFQLKEERTLLPLGRAHRGKHFTLIVRFPNQGRQPEDIDIWTHSNESLATVRRRILARIKSANQTTTPLTSVGTGATGNQPQISASQLQSGVKLDLYLNNELIEPSEGHRLVAELPLRDRTLLTAKLSQSNTTVAGSPDSSSDSSTGGSPQHASNPYQQAGVAGQHQQQLATAAGVAENMLPGVIMSRDQRINPFLCQLADLGCQLQHAQLRDAARNLLRQMPADPLATDRILSACQVPNVEALPPLSLVSGATNPSMDLENIFVAASPSSVLYHLEVAYSLLMPATAVASEKTLHFQLGFILNGGIPLLLNSLLSKSSFLSNADVPTKRSAYLNILRLSKVLLSILSHLCWQDKTETATQPALSQNANPGVVADYFIRTVASQLSQHLQGDNDACHLLRSIKPDAEVIRSLIRLALSSSSGDYQLLVTVWEDLGSVQITAGNTENQENEYSEDMQLCREALEVMTIVNTISPETLLLVSSSSTFYRFSLEMILLCQTKSLRYAAAEQFLLISTQQHLESSESLNNGSMLSYFLDLLFSVLPIRVPEYSKQSQEFFQLLCRLLHFASTSKTCLPSAELFLSNSITWLKNAKENFFKTGSTQTDDNLLEGYLCLTRELVSYLGVAKKLEVGSNLILPDSSSTTSLIKEILEDFLYPASRLMNKYNCTGELVSAVSDSICTSSSSILAALDLLVSLSAGCFTNMKLLTSMLTEMFFSDQHAEPVSEWEYLPPVGPRASQSFVGLKNAGATCYMNSVLQQLFMIERLRRGVLLAHGAALDPDEDFNGDEKMENDTDTNEEQQTQLQQRTRDESNREYNINILKQLQAIFGHLDSSKLQYYVPRGLWRHFKLQGEPVNLREQQDAVEFYMSLTDSVDEALKALGCEQIMHKTLVGIFSDQKICKGCPHRYCKEQPFNVISIDIRNHSNLHDSLEQYVKGELLEGGDAYHCEKCNKKVNTVKRLCVKKLPPILAIQLKRFEYDYERLCPIKFNDYFEFPRILDMEPYTVWGLAKAEGEIIDYDIDEETNREISTRYHLTGIVVHSGQASGGHYYSYIHHRRPTSSTDNSGTTGKWYKFDDGDVTECKMDDDEEMKNQCFGGEYMGEVFDHVVKRMSYRRQKRWWNAYILFYTKEEVDISNQMSELVISESITSSLNSHSATVISMPSPIERSVRKQNIKFQHTYNQFSTEFFHFMRKLISSQTPYLCQPDAKAAIEKNISPQVALTVDEVDELALLSVEIGARFLFTTCLHTKKSLRGIANDWYEALLGPLRASKKARVWFGQHVLLDHPQRFCEYLLQCPSAEVRSAFVKILVFLAHMSLSDGPCMFTINSSTNLANVNTSNPNAANTALGPSVNETTLADHIFQMVLALLSKEVADYGRHLSQYFNLFLVYASLGPAEKAHLLRLNVLATFMTVALDEGPGPPIKYQYAELGKLYQVTCLLIRSCDISSKATSSVQGQPALVNALGETPLMPIQPQVADILYSRSNFVKKLLEDASSIEETSRLLRYCCWENNQFSFVVLSEILWQVAFAYTYELRPHLDLLLSIITLEDSWQKYRITAAFKGIPDDRDGLFDIIQRSKNHYHKRAYQCIKCLVTLFSSCPAAHQILLSNAEFKRKWAAAVDWLHEELDRPYPSGNNQYNQWSPPAQSNETSNGYFLERSHSARLTLDKSIELCPEEEAESEDQTGGGIGNGIGENTGDATGDETDIASVSMISDDPAIVKPIATSRTMQGGIAQPRPGHAQAATPRASVPINPNPSMVRSTSSQFTPLHPNRPQQPPKNDCSVPNSHTGTTGNP